LKGAFEKYMPWGLFSEFYSKFRWHLGKTAVIMYTAGGQRIFFKGAKFVNIPPHHTKFFDNPSLDQMKKGHPPPSLDKYDMMKWCID